MRFDVPIWFQTRSPGEYDPDTGDYGEDSVVEELAFANVTDTQADMIGIVYGDISQESYTVRVLGRHNCDTIMIGGKVYKVDKKRTLRRFQTFIVSEVQ